MKKILQIWIEEQMVLLIGNNVYVKSINIVNKGKYSTMDMTPKIIIILQDKTIDILRFRIPCYYYLSEIKQMLKEGYELYWDFKRQKWIQNSEITLRKINK